MKKCFYLLLLAVSVICGTLRAQTYQEDGYSYYYSYDHRVVVRSCVECTDHYQDLWNGDHVRIINGTVYIYRGNTRVTYGDRVWLEHTGNYTVERGGTMYLQDDDGNNTGVYGTVIDVLWNGICRVKRSNGYWYLYTRNNQRLGSIYSTEKIGIYWNGYYSYRTQDGYYRVADDDGDQMSNSYSEEEATLTNGGNFTCLRNGSYYTIDTSGRRVY